MSKIGLALMLLTWMLVGAVAQAAQAVYRLAAEDFLSIRIYGEQEMSVDAPVALDGTIGYPFLGFIKVAGMTAAELEQKIRRDLIEGQIFVDPKVSVNIVRFRPMRASVVGIVQKPGQYEFKPGDRVLSLIAQAGGQIPDRSDLKRTTIVRKGSVEQIPLDLEAMLERGDLSQNYELQDGDIVNIPEEMLKRVNIIGNVVQPRQVIWEEGMTVADAIAIAGGEIPNRSRMSQVTVQRPIPGRPFEYRRIQVDFVRFVTKNDYSQNIELEPGDIVYVPAVTTPDINRLSAIANIVFTIQSILDRNFRFGPRF
jgi:polysaccharide export outer membrane protein